MIRTNRPTDGKLIGFLFSYTGDLPMYEVGVSKKLEADGWCSGHKLLRGIVKRVYALDESDAMDIAVQTLVDIIPSVDTNEMNLIAEGDPIPDEPVYNLPATITIITQGEYEDRRAILACDCPDFAQRYIAERKALGDPIDEADWEEIDVVRTLPVSVTIYSRQALIPLDGTAPTIHGIVKNNRIAEEYAAGLDPNYLVVESRKNESCVYVSVESRDAGRTEANLARKVDEIVDALKFMREAATMLDTVLA